MSYQRPLNTRREARSVVGRFRSGRLSPVQCVPVLGNEGGMLQQSITMELDPIAGRMITPIFGELIAVFVPVEAMDALKNPEDAYAGMTEVIREKLLTGNGLFSLIEETEISKRCRVVPASYDGVKRVNEVVRLGHNCAANYLRRRRWDKAPQLLATNNYETPAIISQTALEKLNGVLDPDDHVNGAVKLDIPNMSLPVEGIGMEGSYTIPGGLTGVKETGGTSADYAVAHSGNSSSGNRLVMEVQAGYPAVFAKLNGAAAGNVSLTDFYRAEKMDRLTRTMREILEANPEYGEEMVLRWAHGMSVDAGKVPWVIAEKSRIFGRSIVGAVDSAGIAAETMRSDMAMTLNFTIPIPRTELGGVIMTFAVVRPDETLGSQPHPILADNWKAENYAAAEMELDPVGIGLRWLHSECPQVDESVRQMYTGYNGLKRLYVDYGLSRMLDPATITNKTAVWQLELSPSVSPDTILYPDDFPQNPFVDQNAEVCTYILQSQAVIRTPLIFGPSPVEQLETLNTTDLFNEGA